MLVSDNELSVLMPQRTSLLNFVVNQPTLYKDQIRICILVKG